MSTIFGRLLQIRLAGIEQSFRDREIQSSTDIKGDAAEIQLRALVAEFIPPHIGVARGWIFDSQDRRTNERDIVVYSKNNAPGFLFDSGSGLIPAESVLYDIQVRSTAKRSTLKSELKTIRDSSTPRAGRNVLMSIACSTGDQNLLSLYESLDDGFLTKPDIRIFVCGDAGYFYFHTKRLTLGSIFSEEQFLAAIKDDLQVEITPGGNSRRRVSINGQSIDSLRDQEITISSWRGIREKSFEKCATGFLQGFSNTLFESQFGRYLGEHDTNWQSFSIVIQDPMGNQIFKKVDLANGFSDNYQDQLTWSLNIGENGSIALSVKSPRSTPG